MIDRRVVVVLLAVPLLGCLEPPVSETLEVRMLRGGASLVTVGVSLRDPSDYDNAPRVQQRLEAEARELNSGSDPWSDRFRRVEPSRRRDVVDRDRGRLNRVRWHALLDGQADLREFFRDTGVEVVYAEGEGWAELTLTPGRPSRATSAQRQRLAAELAGFTAGLTDYAAAMKRLYDHLSAHPDRARACLGTIVADKAEAEPLRDDESALVDAVNDAIGAITTVLGPVPGESFTLDEISRLVYDPFPAPMRVMVPGTIEEREGFAGDLASELNVPVLSIWSAFERLEGRWFAPDPALALWRHDAAKSRGPFDLDAFLAIPRRAAAAPLESEVRGAIDGQLTPAPVYRVRFKPDALDAAEAEALRILPEP